jgi:hypothetical protein
MVVNNTSRLSIDVFHRVKSWDWFQDSLKVPDGFFSGKPKVGLGAET